MDEKISVFQKLGLIKREPTDTIRGRCYGEVNARRAEAANSKEPAEA